MKIVCILNCQNAKKHVFLLILVTCTSLVVSGLVRFPVCVWAAVMLSYLLCIFSLCRCLCVSRRLLTGWMPGSFLMRRIGSCVNGWHRWKTRWRTALSWALRRWWRNSRRWERGLHKTIAKQMFIPHLFAFILFNLMLQASKQQEYDSQDINHYYFPWLLHSNVHSL